MDNIRNPNYYLKRTSLTEWALNADLPNSREIIHEDSTKNDRLGILNHVIGLPVLESQRFDANDILSDSPAFLEFKCSAEQQKYAIRATPKSFYDDLPVLRNRDLTVEDLVSWIFAQDVDLDAYSIDFTIHKINHWSTIFIVNEGGVFGDIIEGSLHQLSQGFHQNARPIYYEYNFATWILSEDNKDIKALVNKVLQKVKVTDYLKQEKLTRKLGVGFSHAYLTGYFEAILTYDSEIWFIDYSRVLGRTIDKESFHIITDRDKSRNGYLVKGQTGSPGQASGRARIVEEESINEIEFNAGEILVCRMTLPSYLPLMRFAGAIVTDMGGILSHAAIICRELNIPCIVGTQNATVVIDDGAEVVVDADRGIVRQTITNH